MLGIAIQTSPALVVSLLCMIALVMQHGHYCHVEQIGCKYLWMCMGVGAQVFECADLALFGS